MLTVFCSLPWFCRRFLLQTLVVSSLSTVGLLLGVVPSLQPVAGLSFGTAAYAQSVSDQEIQDYAKSVLSIEPLRQAAYNQIKQITGSDDLPAVACHRPSSLSNLPDNIRDIAVDYCNQAIAIVERNELTITRFNEITIAHQSDRSLSNRIQQAINQLQSNSRP